jgi:hypothetical protein
MLGRLEERDELFQELFGRAPDAEEVRRFERMGALMRLKPDDSLWYVILVNELYENRLKARLASIDGVADNAAGKALTRISEAVYVKAGELAARREKGYLWRSWGLFTSTVVLLCALSLNAGYMMGSGKIPFWLRPDNTFEVVVSWFFNVPSGWIVLIGSAPFLIEVFWESAGKARFGLDKDVLFPILKAAAAAFALVLLVFVVFAF